MNYEINYMKTLLHHVSINVTLRDFLTFIIKILIDLQHIFLLLKYIK